MITVIYFSFYGAQVIIIQEHSITWRIFSLKINIFVLFLGVCLRKMYVGSPDARTIFGRGTEQD